MLPKYLGFYPKKQLPIKTGDTITIPKGVIFARKGKAFKVKQELQTKIHAVYSGLSVQAGLSLHTREDIVWCLTPEDLAEVKRYHGTDNLERLLPLMKVVIRKYHSVLFLPIKNPSICWWSTEGWCDADINQFVER
jgi:hypothetical protein